MRLVSLDIDPHHRANRIHLGPFVSGLNAVWGPRGAGKSTIAKFIRGLLYHRHRDASGYGQDAIDGLVGSLQWADNSGATRVISSADAVNDRDYRFSGPYNYGQQKSSPADAAYSDSSAGDQPWHRIGGEVYDAVFCGRLGETLPERLWQAARELGIHVATGNEQDETYRRLKAEENRLQQRLHHLRVDDRDRVWWSAERERLAVRLNEIASLPETHGLPIGGSSPFGTTNASLNSIRPAQCSEWESQLVQHRAEHSELLSREADLARRLSAHRDSYAGENSPAYEYAPTMPSSSGRYARSASVHRDHYGTWTGYAKPPRQVRDYGWTSSDEDPINPIDSLKAEYTNVRNRIAHLARLIDDLETKLKGRQAATLDRATTAWESEELRARLSYAEEVLKSWDLYEQTRRRLAEVQSQLQGHGPYHEAARGSFLQCVERYVRELSAGALRQLPTWALEALRRDLEYAAGLSNQGRLESYREVYRDYRVDAKKMDYPVPPSQSSERQLVELAIRMAILESAAHRIGRLPLILDDALDGFHGQTLDHVVRVMIEFARQGQQVLLMTSEQEVAERVRIHHGWVAHLNPGTAEADSWMHAPTANRDVSYATPMRPTLRPVAYDEHAPTFAEVNAQLSAASSHPFQVAATATHPVTRPQIYRYTDYPKEAADRTPIATAGRFFLSERSRIEDAPGMQSSIGQRVRALGIETVGQWVTADPNWIADHLGTAVASTDNIIARQSEARLMCGVPQLRAFDARVLAGCGIRAPQSLAQMHPGRLLRTVETFLTTPAGQEILRSGTSYELSRITTWIASARRSLYRDASGERRQRIRDRKERRAMKSGHSTRSVEKPIQVVQQVEPAKPKVKVHPNGTSLRFFLEPENAIVDAPSIGPRLAKSFIAIGIQSIRDFLKASPQTVASQLGDSRITSETILAWQRQATLVCRVPNLRGHDAQILVACGVNTPEQLHAAKEADLHAAVCTLASSKSGQRLMRGTSGADLDEVKQWIAWSQQSRTLRAA